MAAGRQAGALPTTGPAAGDCAEQNCRAQLGLPVMAQTVLQQQAWTC
jgi:hypothetical protein